MTTAIATLKTGEDEILNHPDRLAQHLCDACADKGYRTAALERMWRYQGRARLLESLFGNFLMRIPYGATGRTLSNAVHASLFREPTLTYDGSQEALGEIDESIAHSGDVSGYRDRIRRGASRFFSLEGFQMTGLVRNTRIGVLGAGAAGLLIARTLTNAGFRHVHLYDVTGRAGGLWVQSNVRGGSKNNPFPFEYEQFRVEAAPGEGESITQFLHDLAEPPRQYGLQPLVIEKAKVLRIEPGDLQHRVYLKDGQGNEYQRNFPVLINALGIGKPLPPSRPGVMTTDTPQYAGIRWQQQISSVQAEALRGGSVILIGLGNSTAEMLVQIQRLNRAGYNIHYTILTHYPEDSLHSPQYRVDEDDKEYRLYRDIRVPQLTKLAGDLETIRDAFLQVRNTTDKYGQILHSVEHWSVEKTGAEQTLVARQRDGVVTHIPFKQLYTLIGYGHSREELAAWGLAPTDDYLGTISYDYDGEVHRVSGFLGRQRVYPGYFACGSLLKSPQNPNAQVIPGMLFRLPDLFAGVVLRAIEAAFTPSA